MLRFIVFAMIILSAVNFGCTVTRGKVYAGPGWAKGPPAPGKVMVMPVRYDDPEEGQAARSKAVAARCAAREALAELPGVVFVEPPPAQGAESPAALSDFEAVLAAREAGADTLCLLSVGEYGENFWITVLLPGFGGNSRVQYSLRLLDVKSGKLLLEAVRERTKGGEFVIPSEGSARMELKKDLVSVLGMRGL